MKISTRARCASLGLIGAGLVLTGCPVQPSASPYVLSVTTGNFHSCALLSTGLVKCWGRNTYGQLGNGTSGSSTHSAVPGYVVGLTDVTAISGRYEHTCALTSSGAVKCWGLNSGGQLGDGTTIDSSVPVDVSGLATGVAELSAEYSHTCARMVSGSVKCWGVNTYGALGDGTTIDSPVPVDVTGLSSGAVALTTGYSHSCALVGGGAVECWGANGAGQFGTGTYTTTNSSATSTGWGSGVVSLAGGQAGTCVVLVGGSSECTGINNFGQLGDGTTVNRNSPVAVTGLAGAVAIASSANHSCVTTTSGGAKCWGRNINGALGDGTTTNSTTAVAVSGLSSGVSGVAAGGFHSCAVVSSGGAKCWGADNFGQVGNGSFVLTITTPVDVTSLP